MVMTGRMKRNVRTSMARVRRAQLMRAELGLMAVADIELLGEGEGTSQRGVMRDRPERRRRKVVASPKELGRRDARAREGEGESVGPQKVSD